MILLIFLINLLPTSSHNSSTVIILLMNNWPIFLVVLLTPLILIKPLVLHLILGEQKSIFPILLATLSLTNSTISQQHIFQELFKTGLKWALNRKIRGFSALPEFQFVVSTKVWVNFIVISFSKPYTNVSLQHY